MRNATKKASTKKKKAPLPSSNVRIRMYRPGLGDCWLLTFSSDGRHHHILIDCGVFIGTPGQKDRLTKIAAHIRRETGNRVQALVATHEHWDHVAGFHFAKDEFQHLKPEEVWAAWTEDPNQTIAVEKKKQSLAIAQAIDRAVTRMVESDSPYDRECGIAAARVMDFGGVLGAAKFSERSDEAMRFVTDQRKPNDKFLAPGDVLEREWLPGGVRIYVLSPPMDRGALRQGRTPEAEGFEDPGHHDGPSLAWSAALLGVDAPADHPLTDQLRPFDVSLAWPDADLLRRPPASDSADAHHPIWPLTHSYRDQPWRRIDHDWLQSAASLALQLDNSINNTSLVLAFELVESGKVLLFVGDSELESWKSWQDLVFKIDAQKTVTAKELLARTVFYKVGHHGSGNATLRAALAQMTSPDLVAAVPTDSQFASGKDWAMPAAKLAPALEERTKGRVLYGDPGRSCLRAQNPAGLPEAAWQRFVQAVDEQDELFVDYHLPL